MLKILKYLAVPCLAVVSTGLYANTVTLTCPPTITCVVKNMGTTCTNANPPGFSSKWQTALTYGGYAMSGTGTLLYAFIQSGPTAGSHAVAQCMYVANYIGQISLFNIINGGSYLPAVGELWSNDGIYHRCLAPGPCSFTYSKKQQP